MQSSRHEEAGGGRSTALRRFRSVAGRALLALYFIACACILLMRWAVTTQLDHHLPDIERIVADAIGVEVRAARVDAGFTLLNPVLTLHDVTLARPGGPVSLRLPKIQAELSWSSVWHLEPRFRTLVVSDPSFAVRKLADGSFDIGGFTIAPISGAESEKKSDEPFSARQPFTAWLFAQERILIENGTFLYADEGNPARGEVKLSGVTAVFRSELFEHRAALSGTLAEGGVSRGFDVRARVERNLLSRSDDPLTWKGELYVSLDRIRVAALLRKLGFGGVLRSGDGAARLWAGFDAGRMTSLTADIAAANVRASLAPELKPLALSRLTGRFRYAETEGGGLSFSTDTLAFSAPGVPDFGPSDLSARCRRDADGKIAACEFGASEVSLSILSKLSASLPMPAAVHRILAGHPVSGKLHRVRTGFEGDWSDPKAWSADGYFTGLTMRAGDDGLPGFRNISGSVSTTGPGKFDVLLDSHYASLFFPGVFREPQMNFTTLSGRVTAALSPTLRLTFSDIVAESPDGRVTSSGTWTATGGAGTIDIAGTGSRINGAAVRKYLPNVIGDPALDYVEAAVLSGRAENARYTVRGRLADFPWDGMDPAQGHFLITADVTKAVLDFMPSHRTVTDKSGRTAFAEAEHWPLLRDISARLEFEGNRMTVRGHSAECRNLRASDVVVEIPSYVADPVMLTVKGRAEGDVGDALAYLSATPFLRTYLGSSFDAAKGSGTAKVTLDLAIPLTGPSAPRWTVDAGISGAAFRYLPILPEVTKLSGGLRVSDRGISTPKPFAGVTAAGPITVSIKPDPKRAVLDIEGTATGRDLQRLVSGTLVEPILERLEGASPFRASAAISLEGGGLRVTGTSPLEGIVSPLPPPMDKPAGRALDGRFDFSQRGDSTRLRIWAEPILSLDLDWRGDTLRNGWVGAGVPMRPLPDGIEAAVRAGRVEIGEWLGIWETLEKTATKRTAEERKATKAGAGNDESLAAAALSRITKIELDGETLLWKGNPLGGISATLRQVPGIWHLRAQSGLASGQIEYATEPKGPGSLTVKLDRLNLPELPDDDAKAAPVRAAAAPVPSAPTVEIGMLPDVSLVIDSLTWGKRRIGKVELSAAGASPEAGVREWRVNDLIVRNAGGTLTTSGVWRTTASDPAGMTRMSARADLTDTGRLLHSLDVRGVIQDAPGKITADLSWRNSPVDFNARTLSGAFSATAGAGQLLQVEPGAGRLLSLLSMQHLLQRLTLDFRDVINRGFRFDRASSEGTVEGGLVTVRKTSVSGSAAAVVLQGDIDLANGLLDLHALVLPRINGEAASLAVAIANPAVGIGTLIAQFMFKDQISNMLSSEYAIRGPIDNPEVSKIADFGTRAAKAAQRKDPEALPHPARARDN